MNCPVCGVEIQAQQRFCMSCGTSLAVATPDPPPASGPLTGSIWATDTPTPPAIPVTTVMPAWQPPPVPPVPPVPPADAPTTPVPAAAPPPVNTARSQPPLTPYATSGPFRVTPLVASAAVTGALLAGALFTTIASSVRNGITGFEFRLTDVSNATVAAAIGAVLLVAGAVWRGTDRYTSNGLSGGVIGGLGISVAGFASPVIGHIINVFDAELIPDGSGQALVITQTRDVGYWFLIAAIGLGIVTFLLSINDGGADGRVRIHPLLAAVGAAASVLAALGGLMPPEGTTWGDLVSSDVAPPATLYMRIATFVLLALVGVIGFMNRRMWGIGIVLGGICMAVWQIATTIGNDAGDALGVGGYHPITGDIEPHLFTTIGVAVMLLSAIVGGVSIAHRSPARDVIAYATYGDGR